MAAGKSGFGIHIWRHHPDPRLTDVPRLVQCSPQSGKPILPLVPRPDLRGVVVDSSRFDQFARRIAQKSSRRSALKTLLGGAIVSAGATFGGSDVEARTCSPGGVICREHANCCSRECGAKDRSGRRICTKACDAGLTNCAPDGCVDLQTDPQHCGACGNLAETDRGEACCHGTVTNLGTDTNCSACGDDCATRPGTECINFVCRDPKSCPPQPTVTVAVVTVTVPCVI